MKVDLITLGCSKNLVDSERLMGHLELNGYEVEHDPEVADGEIAIINTCGFIQDAKKESIDMILDFAARRKAGDLKKLIVMGCLSQRYQKELEKEIPEVDKFYGKFDFMEVMKYLGRGKEYNSKAGVNRKITTPKHYAYVKVSEGCNRMCSYCAIPIMTGRYKSRAMEEIVEEVGALVSNGVKEFQIIAQDLSYYGEDKYGENKLAELVKRLSDVNGVEWLRLHYAYPAGFPNELLSVMRERENVCKYLDIALQHISDNMLVKMRRHITKAETLDLLDNIRAEVPGIHIRTTLMVGHPGETSDDFDELMEFVRTQRFERMGAFTYSDEDGTYSSVHYEDDVPQEVKEKRLDKIMDLQSVISEEINAGKVGKVMKTIIDRKEGDYYVGRTQFDSPEVDPEVLVKSADKLAAGDFYDVKITGAETYDLYGEIVK
ncbi:MAG: 30S ribosomal protein S12 methylthiotransferase RimO [Paludibacteraceae bacterium]|nr:30S ribosomal protein S12 methylthiotransferase RimO [Paludibacteraceae bacterium]MBP5137198.1 30S ribosomal protein S12 methylthiotransferase RimO [Paludibacteraceae bacterium]